MFAALSDPHIICTIATLTPSPGTSANVPGKKEHARGGGVGGGECALVFKRYAVRGGLRCFQETDLTEASSSMTRLSNASTRLVVELEHFAVRI